MDWWVVGGVATSLGALASVGAMGIPEALAMALSHAAILWCRERLDVRCSPALLHSAVMLAAMGCIVGIYWDGVLPSVLRLVFVMQALLWVYAEADPVAVVVLAAMHLFAAVALSESVWIVPWLGMFFVCGIHVMVEPSIGARQLIRLGGAVMVMGGVVFAVTPRPAPLGTALGTSGSALGLSAMAGLSDTIALGRYAKIKRNPRVVARLEIPSLEPGMEQPVYLRAFAFTTYLRERWYRPTGGIDWQHGSSTVRGVVRLNKSDDGSYVLQASAAGTDVEHHVYLEASSGTALCVLWEPVRIRVEADRVIMDPHHAVYLSEPVMHPLRYTVWSQFPGGSRGVRSAIRFRPHEDWAPSSGQDPQLGGLQASSPQFQTCLDIPSDMGRVSALARTLTGGVTTQYRALERIHRHLQTFAYTVSVEPNSLEDFLYETRKGHCEYFATAMCIMARAVGIPTRVVNGFMTGEYNSAGRFYTVRGDHAHAWVEAWFPEVGWMPFDPTPAGSAVGTQQGTGIQRPSWWLGWYQALDLWWSKHVLGYDSDHQTSGIAAVWGWFAASWTGITMTILIGLAGYAVWRIGMWKGTARWSSGSFYDKILRLLAHHGIHRRPAQTMREFVEETVRVRPALRPLIEMTNLYYGMRFGYRTLTHEEHDRVERTVRDIRIILKGSHA